MDIRFLESFIAVVECGSVAEAARRMNLTPAALTQRLRAVEQDLGKTLVARSGRTMQPTIAGLAVLDAARDLISNARDLRAIAANGEPAGQLRLGATATALTGVLPGLIATLHRQHPDIEYFVQPGASADLYHRVITGELDAALIVRPQFAIPKSTDWLTLRQEPLVLLAPADMAISEPHDLLRHMPFIRYDRSQWGGHIVEKYLHDHGITVREILELDALDAIAAMVDRGLGVSIVPDWAPPWPEGLRLRKQVLPTSTWREVGILFRRSGARSAAIQALVHAADRS
ncbi:LysR family transcriptional regulator [Paracoccus fistulariae]|uniref:LysR family transcriptional regulator n=1 Tax=Paracoccus fistulariae TaxID=658446 RepID=A0ABY7SLF5_9RHOB|nr:LysR family transcriptional regulator [Paracoccus fistulariae]MDB6182624.1 LysR family transcriptional regulator [Paracoccus fistulariae]WCR07829.1 LysR family transcriptional regulator [Paracoccus fistulariae]